MTVRIAVVGLACRYPDADDPRQLWENVLAGRRAFRRIPEERTRLADYHDPDPAAPDRFYATRAAVLEGFDFDRVAHRVAGSTYRATDLTHWLAVDTAGRALADAGLPGGEGLNRERTGVIIGNTLTGEFSRASLMRLRWPYVRRTVGAALRDEGWDDTRIAAFLRPLEHRYKAPFPPIDEDSLAGGLANTIAGRVCNQFDLGGGGFIVDGACSSSLLSVAYACTALADRDLDAVLAGGVDLSLDPFELVGFAKTGALARREMRVYDRRSAGFLPGEGCGMVVLMRDEDAVAAGRTRYATIAGWGFASDGKGGITRPVAAGHRRAMRRAYRRAGFGADTVAYLEGHGTGTAVGDAVELSALAAERRAADPDAPPAAVGSVKALIGHTKAAAGAAGLIKAVLAVHHGIIPPAAGTVEPHPLLAASDAALRVTDEAQPWPPGTPVRAGVSSMGFGGINAHVVVESATGARPDTVDERTATLVRSRQDAEILLFDADDPDELRARLTDLAGWVGTLSAAELGDLAAELARKLDGGGVRAAVVADSPESARERLERLAGLVARGEPVVDPRHGVFAGRRGGRAAIGFLFPGQAVAGDAAGGALRRRFRTVADLYAVGPPAAGADPVATEVAQPRIVTGSLAGLRVLAELGIEASGAAGHSLGELTALHWAGVLDQRAVRELARARGRIMAERSAPGGAMASLAAPPAVAEAMLAGTDAVVAGYNAARQTVVSGPEAHVRRVLARAAERDIPAVRLEVSHAFHSPVLAPAARALGAHLRGQRFARPARRIWSTVTGAELPADVDVADLLERQVCQPVRFAPAVAGLARECDLLIEVGPGRILSGLAAQIAPDVPRAALETDGTSLTGLLTAVAAAYALGAPVEHRALFAGRFTRPLEIGKSFRFLSSPIEAAPPDFPAAASSVTEPLPAGSAAAGSVAAGPLPTLRRLVAERAELPVDAVSPDCRPLDELHLSSITVGQIVNRTARELGLPPPAMTTMYATATLAEISATLDELAASPGPGEDRPVAGAGPWARAFVVESVPAPVGPARPGRPGDWEVFASPDHPLAAELKDALSAAPVGDGVLLCLPRDCGSGEVELMLAAARTVLDRGGATRFVVVGEHGGGAGLAKSVRLESPGTPTTLVTLPIDDDLPAADAARYADLVVAEVAATTGFAEAEHTVDGRRIPVLVPLPGVPAERRPALGPGDVLLVTGGGKGIGAECALVLGRDTGAAVGLIGRAEPETDEDLAENLRRLAAAGVRHHYARADVTDPGRTAAAVTEITERLGEVTAVLHGAGRNEPRALAALDEETFRRALAPKVDGLGNVLAALAPGSPRLLVTFGSIIGRAGMPGEAHYATANDRLTRLAVRAAAERPGCRCLALEWSVWAGAGMGERLGVLETLAGRGVEPIPVDRGIAVLRRLLDDPAVHGPVVVMGRAGGLETLAVNRPELPLLRFLDRPRVHYPQIELVADADLSERDDPYLADHELNGDRLVPAVIGMEAMAQAAAAVTGRTGVPVLRDVRFLRPVTAGPEQTVRVAVLAEGDTVRAVLRSGETGFQADHFVASLSYDDPGIAPGERRPAPDERVPLEVDRELYDGVLFQAGRFRRLRGYRRLHAYGCVADVAVRPASDWFGAFQPGELVLADPGMRDAVMHALQACVPDATLLPSGVDRLIAAGPAATAGLDEVTVHAREREHAGDTYVWDVDVCAPDGSVIERWDGLRLTAVLRRDGSGPWAPALLGTYLQRRAGGPLLPASLRVAVRSTADADRRAGTAAAVRQILGPAATPHYRPDGRPELTGGRYVSAAHTLGLTFAVVGDVPVACDAEGVLARPADDWSGLLGADGFALARFLDQEDLDTAATRVWTAIECLRKAGRATAHLTAGARTTDGWVVLHAGSARVASFVTAVHGRRQPIAFAMLADAGE